MTMMVVSSLISYYVDVQFMRSGADRLIKGTELIANEQNLIKGTW